MLHQGSFSHFDRVEVLKLEFEICFKANIMKKGDYVQNL